ncbi:MAG: sugar-binding protein [Bryobacteraceae bacterium]
MILGWLLLAGVAWGQFILRVPRLERAVTMDGDISEWKEYAFSDGVWDLERLRHSPWYDPAINRLTVHGDERGTDLEARYYIAWDETYLYLGADVTDNVNDVSDPAHEAKRWYYKDAICWFIEAPRKATGKKFGVGDNAFCFVIDAARPDYGAWWRHGAPGKTYVEEPLPKDAMRYAIRRGANGDFVLEARVAMAPTLGVSGPDWRAPRVGDVYGLEIVHTDPDGGDYGGHFLIHGRGDDDSTWGRMELTGPQAVIERRTK